MSTDPNNNNNYPSAYDQYNNQNNQASQYNQPAQYNQTPQYNQQPNQYPNPNNPQQYPQYSFEQPKTAGKGMGIAALVLGILSFLTGWFVMGGFLGVLGIIFGIISLVQAKRENAPKGLAITGIVFSALGVLSAIIMFILFITIFPNLFEIADACSQYQNDDAMFSQCIQDQMGFETVAPTGTNA